MLYHSVLLFIDKMLVLLASHLNVLHTANIYGFNVLDFAYSVYFRTCSNIITKVSRTNVMHHINILRQEI